MAIVQHTWAKVALPDPASYYGGYKDPRLLSVGAIKRALSDRRGEYEAATFSFLVSDHDRLLRAKLDGLTSKWLVNRFVTLRMISDEGRRALLTPRTIAIGYIRGYSPISGLQFQIQCEDYLALFTGIGTDDVDLPKRRLGRVDFVDLPTDRLNQPVPIIYGQVSDAASATAPPTLTGTTARGAYTQDGVWHHGWGNRTAPPDPPTAVLVTNSAGGNCNLGDLPGDQYLVMVTSVTGSDESDPDTFDERLVQSTVISANGRNIDVAWTAPGVAPTSYRVYLGMNYFGPRWIQVKQVNHPTVTAQFNNCPSFAEINSSDYSQIATGASQGTFSQFWYYKVSAVMADGETGLSSEGFGESRAYRRPIRVEWLPVAGALEYRVYRRGPAGTFDRRWTVTAAQTFFDDDLLDTNAVFITGAPAAVGAVPLIWVGSKLDVAGISWYAFLVAGHAVKEITAIYQGGVRVDPGNYGVTFAVPGQAGYSTYFPNTGNPQYYDINGRRYTLVFARGPQGDNAANGSAPLAANVKGIESIGDGQGALITDAFSVYLHLMRNWILGDYQAGTWPTSGPVWPNSTPPVEVLDDASFAAASAIAATRITGGYTAAFVIGANAELATVREWIKRMNLGTDAFAGFSRKSQFFVKLQNESVALLPAAMVYRQVTDIYAGSFGMEDRVQEWENLIPYSFQRNYNLNAWSLADQQLSDAAAIASGKQTKPGATVELWPVTNATQATDIIQRRLLRSKELPRVAKFTTGLQGLSTELGDIVKVTHIEGTGATGWIDRPIFVTRHELDPDRMTVTMEGYDVDRLFEGSFILGDETSLPASYASASTAQRVYGYLGDETTGTFANGDAIKRLR